LWSRGRIRRLFHPLNQRSTTSDDNSPRVPITQSDVDVEFDRIRKELTRELGLYAHLGVEMSGPAVFKVPETFEYKQVPEFRPVVSQLVAGNNGDLLILRQDLNSEDSFIWDYMNSAHEVVGRFSLPKENRVRVVRLVSCSIYGVALDELDVPSIVRYRCPRRVRKELMASEHYCV
jgi:hypothetical protein